MPATWMSWNPPPAAAVSTAVTPAPVPTIPHPTEHPAGRSAEPLLALFRRVTRAMTRPAEQSRLLQMVVEEAARLLRAPATALFTLEPDEAGILRTRVGTGVLAEREGELLPVEGSFVGRTLLGGEPQHTADLTADRRAYRTRERGIVLGPALAVALSIEGKRIAVLLVARDAGATAFDEAELDLLTSAAEAFAAALENSAVFEQARDSRAELEAWRRESELLGWFSAYECAARADARVAFLWDLEGGTFRWSPALEPVFGFGPAHFGLHLEDWTERVHEADRARVRDEFRRSLQEGDAVRAQCRLLHPGGAYRQLVIRTVAAENSAEPRRVGVLEDITERERLATHRDQRTRAVAASEIVRALRHEINNPLAVVIGQLQLLQKDGVVAANPELQQSLRAIHEESVRMHELVRRLATLEQHPREPFVSRGGGLNVPGDVRPVA